MIDNILFVVSGFLLFVIPIQLASLVERGAATWFPVLVLILLWTLAAVYWVLFINFKR